MHVRVLLVKSKVFMLTYSIFRPEFCKAPEDGTKTVMLLLTFIMLLGESVKLDQAFGGDFDISRTLVKSV